MRCRELQPNLTSEMPVIDGFDLRLGDDGAVCIDQLTAALGLPATHCVVIRHDRHVDLIVARIDVIDQRQRVLAQWHHDLERGIEQRHRRRRGIGGREPEVSQRHESVIGRFRFTRERGLIAESVAARPQAGHLGRQTGNRYATATGCSVYQQ